jgi:hypothetical protein
MTRENESFLAMCFKVKNFGVKNIASLGAVPAVLAFFTQLGTMILQLIAADSGSRADLTGYAITKANKRSALETLALKVSNALSSYAVINGDMNLKKRADFPSSKWYVCSEEELVTQVTTVSTLATPLPADALLPYGATTADVTALATALTAFMNVIADPTLFIDVKKEDNIKVGDTIDAIRALFNDKLDVLMRSFEVNNPSLYGLYNSARAIDINGSIMAPTAVVELAPATVKTVHTAKSYDADTFYTIENKGSMPVSFSLSTADNTAGSEEVLLEAGQTRVRLASNLAPMGVFLVVNNPNPVLAFIRVWVE